MFGFGNRAELVFGDPIKPVKINAKTIEIGRSEKKLESGQKLKLAQVFDFYGDKLLFRSSPLSLFVSRNHCRLTWDNGRKRYLLTDFSKKGTWRNDQRILPRKEYVLDHGDMVALGQPNAKFEIIYPRRYLWF